MSSDLTKHIWLPYTQMKNVDEPLYAVSTKGSEILLKDGRKLIDGLASWWTACHGYNHPHIESALKKQLEKMPHIMFGGFVHEPALQLAERLAKLAPGDLNHVFFVDSGSVAVEVALKMAVQYWLNKGEKGRTKFVSFKNGYHGDTMACMSLCDPFDGMHAHFKNWLPKQIIADLPSDDARMKALDLLLLNQKHLIAGLIIEPLVQAAGGMKFHSPDTLKNLRDLCDKHKILLIADEVFTGFGRTGTMFACEQASIVPDILCIGKALTGGPLTLAATLAREHVYEAFLNEKTEAALMHGPTYMANPLATTAANASLDLFEQEPRLVAAKQIEKALKEGLKPCLGLRGVKDVRVLGAIGVVECEEPLDRAWFKDQFNKRDVWIRPFKNIVYLTPALTIPPENLETLISSLCDVISVSAANKG